MAPTLEADAIEADLTDDQIDLLLKQAEERLRNPSSTALTRQRHEPSPPLSRKRDIEGLPKPYISTNGDIAHADPRRMLDDRSRKAANEIRKIEDPLTVKRAKLEDKKATAGPSWYNLPKTDLTPELKRDLALIRMRSVLDPKRFYKKENAKAAPPEFSQIGTVIEGPTDFYSGRIAKRDRKRTIAEEVMAKERATGKLGKQYAEVQVKKTSGKKGDLKKRMQKRYGTRLKQ